MITVRQNRYSVPVALVGLRVPRADRRAGDHRLPRRGDRSLTMIGCAGASVSTAQLDHYLELLVHKPGALAGSLALHQERGRGRWPGVLR